MTTEAEAQLIEAALKLHEIQMWASHCGTSFFRMVNEVQPAFTKAAQAVCLERLPKAEKAIDDDRT